MTLTIEELKYGAEVGDLGIDAVRAVCAELLANREAQPVGYNQVQRDMMKDILVRKLGGNMLGEKLCMDDIHAATMELIKAGFLLYTAPPAPANAHPVAWEMRYWNSGHNCWHDWERITAEQHAEMSAEHATSNDYEFRVLYDAPPATAAPESGNGA